MKESVSYTKKIRQLLSDLKKRLSPVAPPEDLEPLAILTLSVLRANASLADGLAGLERIREEFVDFNEARVAPIKDIADVLGPSMAEARTKAERLTTALNRLYDHGNRLDFDHMAEMGVRERRLHLRESMGMDNFAEAHLMLYFFDAPSIPVDDRLAARLKA